MSQNKTSAGIDMKNNSTGIRLLRPLRYEQHPVMVLLFLLALPTVLRAQFTYTTNSGTITITGYVGPSGAVVIPDTITGLPVTGIGDSAFQSASLTSVTIPDSVTSVEREAFSLCTSLTSVTIPNKVSSIETWAFLGCVSLTNVTLGNGVANIGDEAFSGCDNLARVTFGGSVTNIGNGAFSFCTSLRQITIPNTMVRLGNLAFHYCPSLTGVFFSGNAPSLDGLEVFDASFPTIYFLPGTEGWGANFGGRPTAAWPLPNPLILVQGPQFGVQTNAFGFRVSWATNIPVVVEACANLAAPDWSPISTNTLASGWSYFSDPEWTNYPSRIYRVRSQ